MERINLTEVSQAELNRRSTAEVQGLDPFEKAAYQNPIEDEAEILSFDDDPRAEHIARIISKYKHDGRTEWLQYTYLDKDYAGIPPARVDVGSEDMISHDLSKFRVLTKKEERDLFFKLEENLAVCANPKSVDNPTDDQREALLQVVSVYKTMIVCNRKLIAKYAVAREGRGLSFEDLMNWGMKGVAQAVCKFDISRGNKFSTYAVPWIQQTLDRALADYSRTIRIPVNIDGQWKKVHRVEAELSAGVKGEVTDREIGEHMGMSEEQVAFLRRVGERSLTSLNMKVGEDEVELGELKKDEKTSGDAFAEEIADNTMMADFFNSDVLTSEEKLLISLRLDLDYSALGGQLARTKAGEIIRYEDVAARLPVADEVSLTAVGHILGVSRQEAKAMEKAAHKKLRDHFLREKLLAA